jgi:asparagine synthase (glutamine-hydrolysing)
VALGHARLSIIDLSADGHQPMTSSSGRFTLVFNGEIYNFMELRRELSALGFRFRSRSDAEVLLVACEVWGVDQAVKRSVGMFAFALWDHDARVLTLARDRLGKKPLYYGQLQGCFAFASELKALSELLPGAHLDPLAIAHLLRWSYIGEPRSIFSEVKKLLPGTMLSVRAGEPAHQVSPISYWDAAEAAIRGERFPLVDGHEPVLEALLERLREAVQSRLIADVPLGALLSGGIDSSLICALMVEARSRVRTFSIGFAEAGFDEAPHAAKVARHLGTEHTEFRVGASDALSLVDELPRLYDEPFADSSQVPTYLVCKLARQHVTVALTGDGGDELFGGYTRYRHVSKAWTLTNLLPYSLRRTLARARALDEPLGRALRSLPESVSSSRFRNRLLRSSELLRARSEAEFYSSFVAIWEDPDGLLAQPVQLPKVLGDRRTWAALSHPANRMMAADVVSYLPGDILTKVDRASMGASLEARSPLLDHRVAEFAFRLPGEHKIRGGQGKWHLRRLLARYLPGELFERPKQGFSIPLGRWLRCELKPWANSHLSPDRLHKDGVFEPTAVHQLWNDHLSGRTNAPALCWSVLALQSWLDRWESDYGFRPAL